MKSYREFQNVLDQTKKMEIDSSLDAIPEKELDKNITIERSASSKILHKDANKEKTLES